VREPEARGRQSRKERSTENPVCPLCQSSEHHRRFSDSGYDVLACEQCDLLFIHPYPASEEDQHRRVATYDFDDLVLPDPDRHYRIEIRFYQHYWPLIEQDFEGADSVLDVGCGCGRLLELLGSHPGLFRAGIELNGPRAAMARRVAGCPIHEVPVEEFAGDTRFDVITLVNVLSHLPSFDSLFGAVRSLLTDRGKLILKVGEVAPDVRKNDLFDWDIPDHLHFLGLRTIDHICRKYRFTIVRHRRVPHGQELFSQARWKTPGRSRFRNLIKTVVVHIPFALPLLAKAYELRHDQRIHSSLIVLSPERE
jgi:SAM-dependent methyltransferase